MSRVQDLVASTPAPDRQEINEAFWQACHRGQRRTAEYLLGTARTSTPPWRTPMALPSTSPPVPTPGATFSPPVA
jgi:hypothetical protein